MLIKRLESRMWRDNCYSRPAFGRPRPTSYEYRGRGYVATRIQTFSLKMSATYNKLILLPEFRHFLLKPLLCTTSWYWLIGTDIATRIKTFSLKMSATFYKLICIATWILTISLKMSTRYYILILQPEFWHFLWKCLLHTIYCFCNQNSNILS